MMNDGLAVSARFGVVSSEHGPAHGVPLAADCECSSGPCPVASSFLRPHKAKVDCQHAGSGLAIING
jgi:hypothetical protein